MIFRIALAVSLFLPLITQLRAEDHTPAKISPPSWYLEINKEVSDFVFTQFKVRLGEGLYYTDQRLAWDREDVSGLGLIDPVSLQNKSLPSGSGIIGMSLSPDNQSQELWLMLTSQEKFHLASKKFSDTNWSDHKFIDTPVKWIPVIGGLLIVDGQGMLQYHLNGKNQNLLSEQLKLHIQDFRDGKKPLIHYDIYYNRVLVAARRAADAKDTDTDTDLYAIDLSTKMIKQVWQKFSWPFNIGNSGLHFVQNNDLYYFQINLALFNEPDEFVAKDKVRRYEMRLGTDSKPIDSYEFTEKEFFILRPNATGRKYKYVIDLTTGILKRYAGEVTRFRPTTDAVRLVMQGIDHTELVKGLNLGSKAPVYALRSVEKFLSDRLSSVQNTWAILRYDKGQLPEELIASFVWDVRAGFVPATSELSKIDAVWQVDAEKLFDTKDTELIRSYMINLRDVIINKDALLYLHNFPTSLETEGGSDRGTVTTVIFWKTFETCLKDGTCRVVMSMTDLVYKALNQNHFDILRNSDRSLVAKLEKVGQKQVAQHALEQLERKKGKRVSDEAFDYIFEFMREMGRNQASPANEIDFLKALFVYGETHHKTSNLIDRNIASAWVDYVRGIAELREKLDVEGLRKFLHKKVVGHEDVIDSICDSLKSVANGTHFGNKPLAFNTLVGTPGIGKTYLAKLVADYLTGKGSLLLVDMRTFSGFPKDHSVRQALEGSTGQIRVVLFDDVDQVNQNTLDLLAGAVEEGVFAQGDPQELRFSNTIMFWTANWGADIIRDRTASATSIREKLRRALTTGDKPILKERIWSRISNHVHPMRPFTEKQLFQLALVHTEEHQEILRQAKNVQLVIDPRILLQVISIEEEDQAGARSIISQLETKVFPLYQDSLAVPNVKKIVMLQVNNSYEIFTDRDADFKEALDEIEKIKREIDQQFKDNSSKSHSFDTWQTFLDRLVQADVFTSFLNTKEGA